jgi:hypothetical protein
MTSIYYSAVWDDSGCLISCWHEHATIPEATECINGAAGYVVGVENGLILMRSLTADEEAEFQRALHARPGKRELDAIQTAEEQYRNDGTTYAVMVRIEVEAQYKWTTWMTYDTYREAAARAGAADKVVVFGSPQWVELKKHAEPIVTDEALKEFTAADRPTRDEGETLVEYVNRFLEAYGISQPAPAKGNDTCRPIRVRIPDFIEFIWNWLTEWDTKELERMYALEVPAWLEALRKRVRRALKHEVPSGR